MNDPNGLVYDWVLRTQGSRDFRAPKVSWYAPDKK
jgi:sucrose-6-phosphate hydrolase SacC (GH32 family)